MPSPNLHRRLKRAGLHGGCKSTPALMEDPNSPPMPRVVLNFAFVRPCTVCSGPSWPGAPYCQAPYGANGVKAVPLCGVPFGTPLVLPSLQPQQQRAAVRVEARTIPRRARTQSAPGGLVRNRGELAPVDRIGNPRNRGGHIRDINVNAGNGPNQAVIDGPGDSKA